MNVVIMMQRQKSVVESLINALKVELLVAMVYWHDILFAINNMVSKKLQSKSMCIDSTIKQLEYVLSYFFLPKNYK